MTNAIAKAIATGSVAIPRPSRKLVEAIDDLESQQRFGYAMRGTTAYEYFVGTMPTPDVVAEATQLLQIFDQMVQPPAADLIRGWLRPLAAAVRNPPSKVDFDARIAALVMVSQDLPTAAFNTETQRTAICEFTFWPSVAEIRELLVKDGRRYWGPHRHLLKIVSARPMQQRHEAIKQWHQKLAVEGTGRLFPSERPEPTPMSGGLF
jgi:hypothetical protein